MPELPDPRIIPGNTPAEGARWVVENRPEALRRVRKLREQIQDATGGGGSSTSVPSQTYSDNWESIFGQNETKKKESGNT